MSPHFTGPRRRRRRDGPGARAASRGNPSAGRRTPSGFPRTRRFEHLRVVVREQASRRVEVESRSAASQNFACSFGAPKSCDVDGVIELDRARRSRSCFTASAIGCEFVSNTSRLPSARMCARNSRAPGSHATCERTSRCSAPMSMPRVRDQYSMQYQSSVPLRSANSRRDPSHAPPAGPSSARRQTAGARDRARYGCRRPGRAACRRDRAARCR